MPGPRPKPLNGRGDGLTKNRVATEPGRLSGESSKLGGLDSGGRITDGLSVGGKLPESKNTNYNELQHFCVRWARSRHWRNNSGTQGLELGRGAHQVRQRPPLTARHLQA